MKRLLFLILILVSEFFYLNSFPAPALANSHCITFNVRVNVPGGNYPGGVLQVGCPGDGGNVCVGNIKNIRVGQSDPVVLAECSCFPTNNGCLTLGTKLGFDPLIPGGKKKINVITPLPPECSLIDSTKICGSNGQVINANFNLTCRNTTQTPTFTPTPTPTPKITLTPTLTPTPSICVGPKAVTNVRVSCPSCFSATDVNKNQ